jgi:alkylhydroperoxidase family enzyme
LDGHEAFLQAAGGDAARVAHLVNGTAADATPLERELIVLARKTCEQPARLTPSDLNPIRELVGDGAIDYAVTAGAFHFINRIADLLHVDPEALPESLRRFELLRRWSVRAAAVLLARMDLRNRTYPTSYEEALRSIAPIFERDTGRAPAEEFAPVRSRAKVIEILRLALEERDTRSSLDRDTVSRIHRTVEATLPARIEDAEGFHPRPPDPVAAFAFVGTRYAYRTTADMIDALRRQGFDDLGILDLAIAVADANQWARMHRLLGLDERLFYLHAAPPAH